MQTRDEVNEDETKPTSLVFIYGGAKPPPKGLIKAKFTYFSHFFLFLDQTCQIDYDCWPNDIKFLFDSKC